MTEIGKGCKVMLLSPAGQGGRKKQGRNVAQFKGFFFVDGVSSMCDVEGKERTVYKLVDLQGRLFGRYVNAVDMVHVGQDHTNCKNEKGENTK